LTSSPFIVKLYATYSCPQFVYYLLEAALGGEVFTMYESNLNLYGDERLAKFYVACVSEALTHLHSHNIIYRDLKPENLILDSRGFCKLADMGLAKSVPSGMNTLSVVGTVEYMAPEVMLHQGSGYNHAVDWWTVGIFLYECLKGRAPFEGRSQQEVYQKLCEGIEIPLDKCSSGSRSKDLVRQLCTMSPEKRIRTPDLRTHLFFYDFDWRALQNCTMKAPFKPPVDHPRDLRNFRPCEKEEAPCAPYVDDGSGWDLEFQEDVADLPVPDVAPLNFVPVAVDDGFEFFG